MILSGIRLSNFKAFGASQRIPLRPITLVFGANSAGKSSLIHALALANHALDAGELDTHRTSVGGEAIDLGGFRQYVYCRNLTRQVELAFELETSALPGRVGALLGGAREVVVELGIGLGATSGQLTLDGESARTVDRGGNVRVERCRVEADGRTLLSMSARPGGMLRLDRLDKDHPVLREFLQSLLTISTTTTAIRDEDLADLGDSIDALVPEISAECRRLLPRVAGKDDVRNGDGLNELVTISRGRRQEDLARAVRLFLPAALADLVNGLSDAIEGEIRRLRYLGPLRSYPPRHLAFAQHQDLNWFAGGGYAWDVVRTNPEVRRLVNAWLGDTTRLRSPYELHVRELLPAVSLGDELPSLLESESANNAYELLTLLNGPQREDVLRIAELIATRTESPERSEEAIHLVPELGSLVDSIIDIDRTATSWVDKLVHSCSEGIQDLVLIDKRTGTPVSHRDVGIGVSQVLPVLVSAYGLGNQLVAIEQPEIHLHPALQAELGDVFIGSALGEQKNTFLLETHSEHLILRVLRRIRETFEDELEDGMVPITPNDVAVLYVERASDGAKLTHIPITEDGEFERPWPEGFFPERSRELF